MSERADLVVGLGSVLTGRYRLERRNGRGGMADVYSALDETLQRRVAVTFGPKWRNLLTAMTTRDPATTAVVAHALSGLAGLHLSDDPWTTEAGTTNAFPGQVVATKPVVSSKRPVTTKSKGPGKGHKLG